MVKSMNLNFKKMMKKSNVSLVLLYFVFALSMIFLGHLLMLNDDESLFIFITMSFIIYMSGGNMLYVLSIPLVFVSLLKMMKSNYQRKEGFSLMENEQSNIEERIFLVNWIQQNIQDFPEYEQFKDSLDKSNKVSSLSSLIDSILELNMESLDVEEIDIKVADFLKYVRVVIDMDEEERDIHDLELKFLERFYAQITADYLNNKNKKQYIIVDSEKQEDDVVDAEKK